MVCGNVNFTVYCSWNWDACLMWAEILFLHESWIKVIMKFQQHSCVLGLGCMNTFFLGGGGTYVTCFSTSFDLHLSLYLGQGHGGSSLNCNSQISLTPDIVSPAFLDLPLRLLSLGLNFLAQGQPRLPWPATTCQLLWKFHRPTWTDYINNGIWSTPTCTNTPLESGRSSPGDGS